MRKVSVALIVAFASLVTACSSGKPEPTPCTSPVSTTTVTLADYSFIPGCTAAPTGSTLTVTDGGSEAHTFTVKGTSIDVIVASGETTQVPLTGVPAGTYQVICTIHPQMLGALQVG